VVWGPVVNTLAFKGFSETRYFPVCASLETPSKRGDCIKLNGELQQLLQSTDSNIGFRTSTLCGGIAHFRWKNKG